MTTDNRVAIRDRIVTALAEAAGADLACETHGSRYRRIFVDQALDLIGMRSLPADLPKAVSALVAAYRENDAALDAARADHLNHNAAAVAASIKANRGPEPDHNRRTIHVRDEVTGRLYAVTLPVDCLAVVGNDEAEQALAARGLPRVRRAGAA